MAFSKLDLEKIKNKILLSNEIEKKTRVIKKGKDYWCCCLFHEEKTPSCKIDDDRGSFYCFGCGAKGDIFTLYTDLYNYSFLEAVSYLSQRAGSILELSDNKKTKEENITTKILTTANNWFIKNLNESGADPIASLKIDLATVEPIRAVNSLNIWKAIRLYCINGSL